MQTAAEDRMVGRTLEGRYRILGRIARGGMSVVYEAVDTRLDRLVAVKVMASALSADPKFVDRFSREARAAARLQHHNVVAVYDQGMDGHDVFLVMELVEGRTLRDVIREKGRFTPAEAVSIMEQTLSALAAAHRAGIAHRDVKPENILLSDDGVVKVADFGLARAVESDAESTRTGLMMGTVAYCSPEQITKGEGDPRSDVYAAGIVLFELLTGTPPFVGENAMTVAYQHVHSRVPAPSSRVRAIPSELDELVVSATDRDASGRPEDAAEFLAELHDVRTALGLPVVAFPAPGRTRRPPQSPSRGQSYPITPARPPGPSGPSATEALGPVRPRSAHPTAPTTPAGPQNLVRDTRQLQQPGHEPPPPVVTPPGTGRRGTKKPLTKRQRNRRRSLLIVTIVVILGLIGGAIGWWFGVGRYSTVPSLRGESRQIATEAIQNAGYKLGTVTGAYDHEAQKGTVLSTDPGSGAKLERGETVNLTVSLGPHYSKVPAIKVGTSEAAAIDAIKAAGLTPKHDEGGDKFSTKVDKGAVVSISPKAGTAAEIDYDTVTYSLSKGPDYVQLPVIEKGASFDATEAALKAAGVEVKRDEAYSDEVAEGGVIGIDPSDRAIRGDTVTVTVSKGPEWITIPEFEKYARADDVESTLRGLGLDVKRESFLGGSNGVVWSMDPPSGTQVHKGDTVTLTVV
jgi:serine/threonine-protein kinase